MLVKDLNIMYVLKNELKGSIIVVYTGYIIVNEVNIFEILGSEYYRYRHVS